MAVLFFSSECLSLAPAVVFAVFLLLLLTKNLRKKKNYNLPPGPPPLPIIGNLHQLGPLPHHSLWRLARVHGPVLLVHLGRIPTVVLSSAVAAREVLKTHDLDTCSRPRTVGTGRLSYDYLDIAFAPYGDYWRDMRKLFILELVSMKRVDGFRFVREEEVVDSIGNKRVVAEDDLGQLQYMKLVLKEAMRLHPPGVLLVPRETMRPFQLFGYDFPEGTRIQVNTWGIGRDPELWEDPERFYPERFENSPIDYKGQHFELLTFGSGRRGCPGMYMGMTMVELTLANLLHRFDWRLADGMRKEDMSMEEGAGLAVFKKVPLLLVPANPFA